MIFVCSKISAGKSTYADQLARTKGYKLIEVSDIVKQALGQTERSKLQGHPELDQVIVRELLDAGTNIVVSGVRQVSILKHFPDAELVWLDVNEEERFRRFLKRQGDKDVNKTRETFELAQQRDQELGLDKVEQYIKSNPKGTVVHG